MGVFFVAGFALFIGFILILVAAATDKKKKNASSATHVKKLSLTQLQNVCVAIAEEMKLEVKEAHADETVVDILATNPKPLIGGNFIIRGVLLDSDAEISAPQIIEFSDTIRQERVSKGILITTGSITKEFPAISELSPIEFIDGENLKEMIQKYQIPLL